MGAMDRIEELRELLQASGADALAVVPGPTLRYLTGQHFESSERFFLLLIPAAGRPCVVLPNLEEANWRAAVSFETAVFTWDDTEGPVRALAEAGTEFPAVSSIAVEPLNMRVMEYELLRERFPDSTLISADGITDTMRLSKKPDEIAAMRKAIAISEAALEEVVSVVRLGDTEKRIASKLSAALLEGGGEGISFGPIVLSGPNSALPHGVPSDRPVQKGEFLLIDFGTSVEGYHSDITRTFVVGAEPDERTRAVYEAVRAGNAAGVAACRPGVTASAVHHAAQDGFSIPAFAKFSTHRTGHGLGLDIHEPPSIMDGNDEILTPGMVFTVEPGLYLEGWGGVRIEDNVLITEAGADVLTAYPRDLRILGA